MKINPRKYYKTGDVLKMHPILKANGYYWLLQSIKTGHIKARNTSFNLRQPRYKIKGAEVVRLIKRLES